jgi:hypothetical protein
MPPLQTPSKDHARFDQICEQVDEFEPLPTVTGVSNAEGLDRAESEYDDEHDNEHTQLDGLILAGLVAPY